MRISPINSQTFKGLLIIPPSSNKYDETANSPKPEVETNDIMEIDNFQYTTEIKYLNDKGEECDYTFYKNSDSVYDHSRILLAYMAASVDKNVVIRA